MNLKRATQARAMSSAGTLVLLIMLSGACTETVATGGGSGGGSEEPENLGHTATEQVSAGEVSTSPKYQVVFTLGQPSPHQNTSTSENYRLRGGVVGANGSQP